ncbi:MAG: hypothetical protein Q4G19_02770 [Clostridia bacterium]|nr:hypothetical protein [Clostridia bacterium]
MRIRARSPDGDLTPCLTADDLLTGREAAAEAIRSRFTLLRGEWWENRSLGFDLPGRLPPEEAEAMITAYIAGTAGITAVTNTRYTHGREAAYSCTVRFSGGEADVNVDL